MLSSVSSASLTLFWIIPAVSLELLRVLMRISSSRMLPLASFSSLRILSSNSCTPVKVSCKLQKQHHVMCAAYLFVVRVTANLLLAQHSCMWHILTHHTCTCCICVHGPFTSLQSEPTYARAFMTEVDFHDAKHQPCSGLELK